MPKRVLVAADVGAGFLERISGDPYFAVTFQDVKSEQALADAVGRAQVLVTRHHNRVTRAVLDAAPDLELIAQGTSGLDNIDLQYAATRNIKVIGLPGENANAVAELVLGHMIALTRTVPAYAEMIRSGQWQRDDCAARGELASQTLGIVGIGRVGTRVARLAATFAMRVIAYDPYLTEDEIRARGAERRATLQQLLGEATILTLHVPLTDETRGMIGARELDLLRTAAVVINTSRGPVVQQPALFQRLNDGTIAGAALDVFEQEPPGETEWPSRSKLIVTPHIAGCTGEARSSIGRMLYEKIREFVAAERS